MNIVLTMSLSGSVSFLFFLLLRYGLGKKIGGRWQYLLMRITILYYLVPLPFLKKFYVWIGASVKEVLQIVGGPEVEYTYSSKGVVVNGGGEVFLNKVLEQRLLFITVWFSIAFIFMVIQIRQYLMEKKRVLNFEWKEPDEKDCEIGRKWSSCYGIKRKIQMLRCDGDSVSSPMVTFTMGIWKPVVFYSGCESEKKREMLLHHEMVHVKRVDALWKFLVLLMVCVHWYNPLVWVLKKEWHEVCEQSCDSEVLRGRSLDEIKIYAVMLINNATDMSGKQRWDVAFKRKNNKTKRRVEKIMTNYENRTKKWGKRVSVFLVVFFALLNSTTVFAYEDVQYRSVSVRDGEDLQGAVDSYLNNDMAFVPNGYEGELDNPFAGTYGLEEQRILYDVQFIDEEGNIYPVEENISVCATCEHTYVSGKVASHTVHSDGSCTVTYYEAKRCSLCGNVVKGAKLYDVNFDTCTH